MATQDNGVKIFEDVETNFDTEFVESIKRSFPGCLDRGFSYEGCSKFFHPSGPFRCDKCTRVSSGIWCFDQDVEGFGHRTITGRTLLNPSVCMSCRLDMSFWTDGKPCVDCLCLAYGRVHVYPFENKCSTHRVVEGFGEGKNDAFVEQVLDRFGAKEAVLTKSAARR
jgi:hypothetical protein